MNKRTVTHLGIVFFVGVLSSPISWSVDHNLTFSSLPSSQGWTYGEFGTTVGEATVFSVDGTALLQNTIGIGFAGQGHNRYTFDSPLDAAPFTLAYRARILAEEGDVVANPNGFGVEVITGRSLFKISMGKNVIIRDNGVVLATHIDNSQFHDYQLEGTPGVGFDFYVDGILVASGPPVPFVAATGLSFGDRTGGTNARVEITDFVFDQNTEPSRDGCVTAPPGLVAWLTGDDDADDLVNNNNGTERNGAQAGTTPARVIRSLAFDGVDDYLDFATPVVPTGAKTFEAWVRSFSTAVQEIYSNEGADSSKFGSRFLIRSGTGELVFTVRKGVGGLDNVEVISNTPVNDENWHHVAATWDGTTNVDGVKLYTDGILDGSGTASQAETVPASEFLRIGATSGPTIARFIDGFIDEISIYDRALSPTEIQAIFSAAGAGKCINQPPIADAGPDQAIRAGDTVVLNGALSFDDNTASTSLVYAWSFSSIPGGSSAVLANANTATPTFIADVADTYRIQLIVTDTAGLFSAPDEVVVSGDNLAPTAVAGDDVLTIAGNTVSLDGSGSLDPEINPLTYAWTITAAPVGSAAALEDAGTALSRLPTDLEGLYEVTLSVSDFIGEGAPDSVQITATTAEDYSELNIHSAGDVIIGLQPSQVTTKGNQTALLNFLSQAIVALQNGDVPRAIDKLDKAIERTDGCVLRGSPDGNGPGRDWITDCGAQTEIYNFLQDGLGALTGP